MIGVCITIITDKYHGHAIPATLLMDGSILLNHLDTG